MYISFGQYILMKGFLHLGTLFMWIGVLSVFGGTMFMLVDSSVQCVAGYGCDDLLTAATKLFLAPQVEMAESVDAIHIQADSGELDIEKLTYHRNRIIASILITFVLFVLFTWIMVKSMTTLNGSDYLAAMFVALMCIAALQLIVEYFVEGTISVPFLGFVKLVMHPEVLIGTINYSEVLPLNTTINESMVI